MRHLIAGSVLLAITCGTTAATGQDVADFYKGRAVTVYISASPGGGYDTYGRLLARHLGRHLPGTPSMVVSNMPGAGGRTVANYTYNVAPKDGSAITIMHHSTIYDAIFGEKGVRYDGRNFSWIGSLDSFTAIGFAWHTSGVKTIQDAMQKEIAMGSTGVGSATYQYPAMLNAMIGTKFKIVTGYKGSTEIYHAVEQGEMHGLMGTDWLQLKNEHGHWLRDNKVNVFVQIALQKHPDLPNVPLALEFVRDPENRKAMHFVLAGREFARPFLAPPGLPQEHFRALRAAFDSMVKDERFRADAERSKLSILPVSGARIQELVSELYETPPETVAKAKAAMGAK